MVVAIINSNMIMHVILLVTIVLIIVVIIIVVIIIVVIIVVIIVDHLQAPEIRHFLYRSRKSYSITSPTLPHLYSSEEDRLRY